MAYGGIAYASRIADFHITDKMMMVMNENFTICTLRPLTNKIKAINQQKEREREKERNFGQIDLNNFNNTNCEFGLILNCGFIVRARRVKLH